MVYYNSFSFISILFGTSIFMLPFRFIKCTFKSYSGKINANFDSELDKNVWWLKCIWNEIFDNDFIGPFESAFEDNTITVYRLLISGLDPKLWRSEVVKIVNFREKNGKKSGTKSIRIDQIYDVTMFTCQIGDYSNGSSSLVTYQNRMKFCILMAQDKLSWSCRENCFQGNTVGPRPLLFKTIMLQLFFCRKQKLTLCVLLPFAFMSRTSW